MALTKFNENVNNVQGLANQPTQTATQLKEVFDKAGSDIKTYINTVLTAEIDSKISELTTKINSIYPVGAIYMSVNSTNPGTLFGGTWVEWGTGKVPVGINTSDTDFNEVEKTGGEKSHQLSANEMPTHSHTFHGYSHNHNLAGHQHVIPSLSGYTDTKDLQGNIWNMAVQSQKTGLSASGIAYCNNPSGTVGHAVNSVESSTTAYSDSVHINASHSHNVTTRDNITGQAWGNTSDTTVGGYNDNNGGNQTHNNLQPYITCYMWKRTA